jgi:N-acetylmuramoyl-L-alanine amidase
MDRGVKSGLFYVLALSKRPGLLIEAGFVSNQDELKKINQEKYLDDLAKAIADGVLGFIRNKK